MPPPGGMRSSLASMVASLISRRPKTAPQGGATPGKGAPILSYSWGQSGSGANVDITQFAPVFQPSGGLFAPGYPLVPVEPERVRAWDFPVGYNYVYTPRSYEPIGFAELRALADSEDLTRMAIETRKNQIEKFNWTISPRDTDDVASDSEKRIDEMTEFWRSPDRAQPFASWLRELLEDLLVLDAPTLEVRRNRGGDIVGLDVIDGATIKVLIDDTGRRPMPPAPAFEQIVHGRPWVLTEDGTRVNTDDPAARAIFDWQLIYMPRNTRPHKSYGYSPVEQLTLTINTALRREIVQLQHFTESNIPPGMISLPEGLNTEETKRWWEWFNSILAGNTAERSRIIPTPFGSKYQTIKEAPFKDGFDEWLARKVCYAFDLPPNAFIERVNRSTSETLQEAALEEGLAPLMGWTKRLADYVIQKRFGYDDLEFQWDLEAQMPPEIQAVMLVSYVKEGIYTRNEARGEIGMDPVDGGDELMCDTASGPVTLDSIINPPEPPPMPMMPAFPSQMCARETRK
jgi:HK97 family phage portal protein